MKGTLMRSIVIYLSILAACGDDGGSVNPREVITTVTLVWTPSAGGTAVVAEVDDPDGDGGDPPTIDPVVISAGREYAVTVGFQNRLEDPPEEITDEVRDEAADHQVFFTGTAVDGPASARPGAPVVHTYRDTDDNGLPIGLANSFTTVAGAGDLIVTLRHLPPLDDDPVKTADITMQVRLGGFGAIGGATDAQVTFPVTVQ